MSEKKKDIPQWLTGVAVAVGALVGLVAIGAPIVGIYSKQDVTIANQQHIVEDLGTIRGNQEKHLDASAKHEEKQDKRIDENADAIKDNGFKISQLGPAGETAEVNRVIALVQDAIDCKEVTDDQTEWICIPAASSDYLPDDLRSRVEEHFRKLGYEVSRQRQLPGGQWRGFWILVEQS